MKQTPKQQIELELMREGAVLNDSINWFRAETDKCVAEMDDLENNLDHPDFDHLWDICNGKMEYLLGKSKFEGRNIAAIEAKIKAFKQKYC